jgi:hypothetical protein
MYIDGEHIYFDDNGRYEPPTDLEISFIGFVNTYEHYFILNYQYEE